MLSLTQKIDFQAPDSYLINTHIIPSLFAAMFNAEPNNEPNNATFYDARQRQYRLLSPRQYSLFFKLYVSLHPTFLITSVSHVLALMIHPPLPSDPSPST